MEIKLENLTPIKKRKRTTSGITINTSGLYITKDAAMHYSLHECAHAVLFEHDVNSFILIGYGVMSDIPHTLRPYAYDLQSSEDKSGIVKAFKVHCSEIKRIYAKEGSVMLDVSKVTVSGKDAILLKKIEAND